MNFIGIAFARDCRDNDVPKPSRVTVTWPTREVAEKMAAKEALDANVVAQPLPIKWEHRYEGQNDSVTETPGT